MAKFQQKHEFEFVLEVHERDPRTKEVISVAFKLCKFFGRDNDDSAVRKRKRTENMKYFKHPFRLENYKSHAAQQGSKWEDYLIASSTEKVLFDGVISRRNTLHSYIEIEGDELSFVLSPAIFEFIGEHIFRQEDELAVADIEVDDVSPAAAVATASKLKRNPMKL
jgi:hypothetical protein